MSSASALPRHTKYLCLVLVILYIAFYMHIPVGVLPHAGHDDGLFFSQGKNILSGRWLGPFSQFTLMKGPGYGFFLAFNALLGIPVTLSQALLHVLATALIAITTWKLTRSRGAGLLCFGLILWHPALFPDRIKRDEIYAAQTLLLLAGVLHCLYIPQGGRRRYAWAAGAGGMTAWLWLTREEGLWVVPALVLLCCITLWQHRKDVVAFKVLCYTMSVFIIAGLACYTTVGLINLRTYGTFAVVDTKDAAFTAALNALQRVRVGTIVPFVPVPHNVRAEIYKVSPTFATLRDYFEGPVGQGWTAPGCAIYPSTCGDFAAGWFLWAFRDAVASRQAYTTPRAAATFFRAIAHEVADACAQRLLACERRALIPFLPAMTAEQIVSILPRLWAMMQLLLCNFPSFIGTVPSGGLPEQLAGALRFLGHPRHMASADAAAIASVNDGALRAVRQAYAILLTIYRHGMPLGAVLGVLAYAYALATSIRTRRLPLTFLIASMFWCLLASRIALLTLVDISSFPAIQVKYLSAGFPVFCLALLFSGMAVQRVPGQPAVDNTLPGL